MHNETVRGKVKGEAGEVRQGTKEGIVWRELCNE